MGRHIEAGEKGGTSRREKRKLVEWAAKVKDNLGILQIENQEQKRGVTTEWSERSSAAIKGRRTLGRGGGGCK